MDSAFDAFWDKHERDDDWREHWLIPTHDVRFAFNAAHAIAKDAGSESVDLVLGLTRMILERQPCPTFPHGNATPDPIPAT